MKKNFDNFDDLMKEKLDGMEFPFNEANWEKASQMIDTARPAKKPNSNLLLMSSIIITGILILSSVYFFGNKLNNFSSEEVAQEKEQKTSPYLHEENSNNVVPDSKQSKNSIENISATDNENSNLNAITKNNINSNTNNTSEKTTATYLNKKTNPIAEKLSDKVASYSNNKNNSAFKTGSNKNTGKKIALNGLIIGAAEGARKKGQANSDNQELNTLTSDFERTFNVNESTSDDKSNSDLTSEKLNEEIAETTASNAASPDTSNGTNSSFTKKKDYVRTKHHTVFVEAGAVNSFGWAVNNVRNGNNISPYAGINYMYNFNSRSSLIVGLQYNNLSNLTESKASFKNTSYEFGIKNDVTTYKITNLHYAVIPIRYIHRFNSSHSFGVGINTNYLMSIQNQIETSKQIENNITETTVKKDVGYGYEQIMRFNTQLALSYRYQISQKIGFNAEINQNLTNIIKDYNFFGIDQKYSLPAAVKLSLTYSFFNK